MRFLLAIKVFWRVLIDPLLAARLEPMLAPPPSAADSVSKPKGPPPETLRLLSLLQRDGRLVDFLQEEIAGYSDAEIGAAVRDIHRDCRKVLLRYVTLEPVLPGEEGARIEVPLGFDPRAIRLTGKVSGNGPHRGTIAHRGWRASRVELPAMTDAGDAAIIAPAEVEIE